MDIQAETLGMKKWENGSLLLLEGGLLVVLIDCMIFL